MTKTPDFQITAETISKLRARQISQFQSAGVVVRRAEDSDPLLLILTMESDPPNSGLREAVATVVRGVDGAKVPASDQTVRNALKAAAQHLLTRAEDVYWRKTKRGIKTAKGHERKAIARLAKEFVGALEYCGTDAMKARTAEQFAERYTAIIADAPKFEERRKHSHAMIEQKVKESRAYAKDRVNQCQYFVVQHEICGKPAGHGLRADYCEEHAGKFPA